LGTNRRLYSAPVRVLNPSGGSRGCLRILGGCSAPLYEVLRFYYYYMYFRKEQSERTINWIYELCLYNVIDRPGLWAHLCSREPAEMPVRPTRVRRAVRRSVRPKPVCWTAAARPLTYRDTSTAGARERRTIN